MSRPFHSSQSIRTLIVEDQPDAMDWLAATIERAFPAATVDRADTLAQGRQALHEHLPDIALVDLGLPDGSGVDLIREITDRGAGTITIVTTIFADDAHLFAALAAGAQGYVLKSESRDELATMLADIVAGRPPLSPAIARRLLGHFRQESAGEVALSEREREILTLLAKGLTVSRAAEMLGVTRNTAAGYAKSVYRKLNITTRAEAALEAARRGLVRP
jgi:DNA-binding NarL/FixJ family response regulator